MNKPELLAPAGSMATLKVAANLGADAIYFGIGTLNARSGAENITEDDVSEAIEYAHIHGSRAYLTLNILLRDDEIPEALRIAGLAYQAGIDAIIVQDIGLSSCLKRLYPQLPLHASTQMNVFSFNIGEFAQRYHFSRVVLPREFSLEEIQKRTANAGEHGIETEVFIHGAECVCYSGLCLFSAMNGNGMRSGNRGLCAQPCRTRFALISDETGRKEKIGRLLSPKDNCALPLLSELISTGVSSLKIEGRMREKTYVAQTVFAYRNAIDHLSERTVPSYSKELYDRLLLAFNRGGDFTIRHFLDDKSAEFMSGDFPGRFGIFLGMLTKKEPRTGVIYVRSNVASIPNRGDYIAIRSRDSELASFPIGSCERLGDMLLIKGLHPQMIEKLPGDALVYRMSDKNFENRLSAGEFAVKIPICIRVLSASDKVQTEFQITDGLWKGISAVIPTSIPNDSTYPPLSESRLRDQLSKVKASPYQVTDVWIDPAVDLRIPVAYVNEIRRQGIQELVDRTAVISRHEIQNSIPSQNESIYKQDERDSSVSLLSGIHVSYRDLTVQKAASPAVGADVYSFSVYDLANEKFSSAFRSLHKEEPEAVVYMRLPGAYKDTLRSFIEAADAAARNIFRESYHGKMTGSMADILPGDILGPSANIYNSYSLLEAVKQRVSSVHLSYELKEDEIFQIISETIRRVGTNFGISLHRYGRIEWMQSEYCPVGRNVKGCAKCSNRNQKYSLHLLSEASGDALSGKKVSVLTHPETCSCELLGPASVTVSAECSRKIHAAGVSCLHTVLVYDEEKAFIQDVTNKLRAELR